MDGFTVHLWKTFPFYTNRSSTGTSYVDMKLSSIATLLWLACVAIVQAKPQSLETSAIHEERFVTIGGIEQWVTIKGDDRNNPVVLFIHGGPGNPLSGLSDSLFGDWESDFTLVHFDQRGAGKSYGRNLPVEELTPQILEENELTLALLTSDGIELVHYLLDYLEKDTLILTGTSWGSALAVYIYQAEPELFSAYIGSSQMVNFQENIAASYSLVLEKAKEKHDDQALEVLHSLGPPPWVNPRNPGQLRRIIRRYETEVSEGFPDLKWSSGYESPEYKAAYYAGEEFSWVKFVGMKGDGFSNEINLWETGLKFEVPVVLIQGAKDLLTTQAMSQRYFDAIEAPHKEFLLIPNAGHDPNLTMLDGQFKTLKKLTKTD